jgi:DNA mismatch repair protein MutS2
VQISKDQLEELEFPKLLAEITPLAYSYKTKARLQDLVPMPYAEAVLALNRCSEYLSSLQSDNAIPFSEYEDIEAELQVMHIENYRLDAESFLKIKAICDNFIKLKAFFNRFEAYFPHLHQQILEIPSEKEISEKIAKVLTKFGEVKDEASFDLKIMREQIRHAKKAIGDNFNRALGGLAGGDFLDDIKESVIDDIRVLAVKSPFKKRVPGRVLGFSKTGSITYIQPESVLKHFFSLKENEKEEKKEVDRILRLLTAEIAIHQALLTTYQTYIFELDLCMAKAKFARKIDACLPTIHQHQCMNLVEAYHPLLKLSNDADGIVTHPQSLSLSTENRIICISGPNAGGKSISLKTVGLLQLMLQSGILLPLHPKSELFFFDKIHTDIGDNQSIENHLSTYSSRLKKMSGIIRDTDENTLLLIDEFGTGSDPDLGGALAEAFLEFFYEKQSYAIITTHYSNIKILVEKLPKAQNAAMLFDEFSFEPMYKLVLGQAGSSFTFEVAEKNRIPRFIIHAAKKKIEKDVVDLDKTIVKLQQEKYELEQLKTELEAQKDKQAQQVVSKEDLNLQLQKRLYHFQKLYEEEHKKLQLGHKLETFIDGYAKGKGRKELIGEFLKILEQEKFNRNKNAPEVEQEKLKVIKRQITQELKKETIQEKIEETKEIIAEEKKKTQALWLKIGQKVRIVGSSSVGTIEKIDKNNRVSLNYGLFTTIISADELERV